MDFFFEIFNGLILMLEKLHVIPNVICKLHEPYTRDSFQKKQSGVSFRHKQNFMGLMIIYRQ